MPYVKKVKVDGNKTGALGSEQRKEYHRKYHLANREKSLALKAKQAEKEEMEEMERINLSPQVYTQKLKLSIELFGDPDDIDALDLLNKEISMSNMMYAFQTGDYSKLKGIVFEEVKEINL